MESQGLLIPQPIALQRANCLGDLVVCAKCEPRLRQREINLRTSTFRFFGWCHLSLACFCDVVQLNSYLLLSNPFC